MNIRLKEVIKENEQRVNLNNTEKWNDSWDDSWDDHWDDRWDDRWDDYSLER